MYITFISEYTLIKVQLQLCRSMITAQEYWSREGMSQVWYGMVPDFKAFSLLLL